MVTVSGGLATFSNITINNLGEPYTLVASASTSSGEIVSAPSGAIDVIPPPTMLVAQSTSSTTVTAGVSFSVTFLVETSQGTLYTGYDGAVMLSVLTGPAGYLPISGAGPETPSNGIVTFPAVILDTAGSYVLQATATSGNLTAGDTGAITVVAGAVASLSIVEEPPTSVGAGSDFSFVVGAEDQFGNPTALSRTVSVAISSNPGARDSGRANGRERLWRCRDVQRFDTQQGRQPVYPRGPRAAR